MVAEETRAPKSDMNRWLKIVTVLCCCICGVELVAAMGRIPTEKLLFEHIGPEDASIPPFIVEVGPVAESTHAVIFVTPETYEDVFVMVKRADDSYLRTPRPMGTFRVTSSQDGKPDKAFTIYPEAVLSVISRLRRMFQSQHERMPEVLVKLETLLTPSK